MQTHKNKGLFGKGLRDKDFHFVLQCPIEWFHFGCVGLTAKPKGKWFCPRCSEERKKVKDKWDQKRTEWNTSSDWLSWNQDMNRWSELYCLCFHLKTNLFNPLLTVYNTRSFCGQCSSRSDCIECAVWSLIYMVPNFILDFNPFLHIYSQWRKRLWENIVEKAEIAQMSNLTIYHMFSMESVS